MPGMASETIKEKCAGSQAFPTNYDGEFTRCDACGRRLRLHVSGVLPAHNAAGPVLHPTVVPRGGM